jgi:DNA-binding FrmR family transcriptional regulator
MAIARRLKRANGHLERIIEMVEKQESCARIAQQLQAVEGAIESAKRLLIHDHIGHSLELAHKTPGGRSRTTVKDLKLITKYL